MTKQEFFSQQFWTAAKLDFYLMNEQANTGIGFDKSAAEALLVRINEMMKEIEGDVEPQLPDRPLNKGELDEWRLPAKPFKKDGSIAAVMEKWMARTGATLQSETTVLLQGVEYTIKGGETTITRGKMRLANQEDIKNYLLEAGWKPQFYNYQRDKRGKPARDEKGKLIQTSPKMQEAGKLCPNLEEMEGELARKVVRWLSLRNRRSVVEGWLANDRLAYDGRLSAGFAGYTNTNRKKHTVVVNLPKAEESVLLGTEMRSLFPSGIEGYILVGTDCSGLESRTEGHYCLPYDPTGEYVKELIEGDIHLKVAYDLFLEQIGHLYDSEEWHKDNPIIKPRRGKAKSIKYASTYGAQPAKLASVLGESRERGEEIYERFWASAAPLARLREKLELFWETTGNKTWIRGLDGRKIVTRSKHSLINTLFQSAGAIAVSYAGMFYNKMMGGLTLDKEGRPCYTYKGYSIYRVAEMHDEWVDAAPEHLAEEVGEIRKKAVAKAGEFLKLRVPLLGDSKTGKNWADIH